MARVIGRDDVEARALLDAGGVRFHRVDGSTGDAPASIVGSVLPEGERQVRASADVGVPEDVDVGMGAWHVNAVDELHVVASGEGVMEFITLDGPVAVAIGAGDAIEIHGAEHRYRPVTPQHWLMRFTGPADGDLGATETGRASTPWPAP
jgi:mannose-6-phosphate isomerase-like protein (cupin superfamily)